MKNNRSSDAQRSCVSCYTYEEGKGSISTPCCKRFVCGSCTRSNPRLREICILCQLPLRPFDTQDDLPEYADVLPDYATGHQSSRVDAKHSDTGELGAMKEYGVQHYVRRDDTVTSLSIAYRVDAQTIRKANHLFADNLLQARLFVIIPGAKQSLSSSPNEDEEQKVRLKRFMLATKCTDYDMAKSKFTLSLSITDETAYMTECGDVVADAVERYHADSQWTRTQINKGK